MNFLIQNAPGKGQGLFAQKDFPAGIILLKFDGVPILKKDIKDFAGKEAANLLQIGTNLYLDLTGHSSFFLNHSCNPNTAVKINANQAFLVSLREIKEGMELTYDYSLTSTEDNSTFNLSCNCSKFKCRGEISGFDSLSAEKQQESIKAGLVPRYVKDMVK